MGRFSFVAAIAAVVVCFVSTAGAVPPPPPISGTHPWLVVLCKFTDRTTEPNPPSYFQQMYSDAGAGMLGMLDYWKDVSYGNLSISGTVVKGWYTLPMTRYQWDGLNRYDKIKTCANAASGDVPDYSIYYGVLAVFNDDSPADVHNTTLNGAITNAQTSITVASSTGFPATPFAVTINDGSTNNSEEVNVTNVSGTTWTISRAYEGSTAQPHANGAAISFIDGGDLGASSPGPGVAGPVGVTLGGKNYTLGMVVLPPETGMDAAAHEWGHGFGYNHSRALSTSTTDYQDCYDLMSGDVCRNYTSSLYTFQGNFGTFVLNDPVQAAAGPGLDAINLDIQGWMPGGRTYNFNNSSCTQTTRDMAALNHPEASGDMEVRIPVAGPTYTIPAPNSTTTNLDYYTVELRDKSGWDRAIPANAILVHAHGTDGYSYWIDMVNGVFIGNRGALGLADEYVDDTHSVYIVVSRMNTGAHTATVTLGSCKINATLTYSGDTTDDYNDSAQLAADMTVQGTSVPVPNADVTLSLGSQSCPAKTDANGHATCSIPAINQDPGTYTAGASYGGDPAFNSTSSSATNNFTITKEESQVTYTGTVTTSHYHDSFAAAATLTDPDGGAPIAGKTVTFTLNGSDTCSSPTDGSGAASCSITPTEPAGTYTLTAAFAGDTDYLSSGTSTSITVTQEETTTTYTGPTVILAGSGAATLTATLKEEVASDPDADGPLVAPSPSGQKVTLSLGAQSCFGFADSSGNVSCTINPVTVPLGPEPLKAEFAGDVHYQPSSDTGKTAIVFAFPSRGAFVLGDATVATAGPATSVSWWSDAWWALNALSGGPAPFSFKGFAGTVTTLPKKSPAEVCGTSFVTLPGNSPPPTSGVPSYMGVLVTGKVTKNGNIVSGNTTHIVVVKVDPGYAPNPASHGTGTIVAVYC